MQKIATTVLAASALALSSAAGASASFSLTVSTPSVSQIVSDVLFGQPCQRVLRLAPNGQRYWANTCDRVIYTRPSVQPVYSQPVYAEPIYADPYYNDYNGVTYSYPTYSYPVRPAIRQTPTHTTIYNTDPYRW